MQLSINEFKFGNPTIPQKEELLQQSYLDDLFAHLKNHPFPENNSDNTKKELNDLSIKQSDINLRENKSILNRYLFYDKNIAQAIMNSMVSDNVDVAEITLNIIKDIHPLITKLKFFYQRPRPFQLSVFYKLTLFPQSSRTAYSPSYPSSHTVIASVVLTVLGNRIPELFSKTSEMIDDVACSRLYLGLHFDSDNNFSFKVAESVLKHPEFMKKYKL